LSPIPNCPSCLDAREPISIAIPFDLLRKEGAMMQKANVSHGKIKMDKMVRGRDLPWVRRSRSLYRGRVVRGAVIMSMERKKSDQVGKKKQRRGYGQNEFFVAAPPGAGFKIRWELQKP
jgi:hypothetical protein